MATHDLVKLFDDRKVRVFYDDESQLWYFCIADVVEILTESRDVPQYIKRMRQRDQELNSVWGTICTPHQFKSSDGKLHNPNCATLESAATRPSIISLLKTSCLL